MAFTASFYSFSVKKKKQGKIVSINFSLVTVVRGKSRLQKGSLLYHFALFIKLLLELNYLFNTLTVWCQSNCRVQTTDFNCLIWEHSGPFGLGFVVDGYFIILLINKRSRNKYLRINNHKTMLRHRLTTDNTTTKHIKTTFASFVSFT